MPTAMESVFTGSITIDGERVTVRRTAGGEVWLTQSEIARLFGVFEAAVRANIRAIYRSEALRRGRTQRIVHGVELYSLEMIAALAFRLRSLESEAFRRWLLRPAGPEIRRGAGLLTGGATTEGPESGAGAPPEESLCIPADAVSRCGGGVRFVWPGTRRRGCPHRGSGPAPLRRDQGVFPRRRRSAAHFEICPNDKNMLIQQLQKMPIRQKCAILTNSAHRGVRSLGFLDFFTYL